MLKRAQNRIFDLSKKYGRIIGLDLPYFIKNGFWVFLRQGVGMLAGLALSIAFARLVSQEIFGQYQLVISTLSIISILSIPGLNASVMQSAARGADGDYKRAVKASFYWSLLGIPVLLLLGAFYYQTSATMGLALMISAIFFPFFYAPNTWDSFLQGKSRFGVTFRYGSTQAIINTIFTIGVIIISQGNLVPIITGYLFSYTFFNILFYWKSLKYAENGRAGDAITYGWFLTKINALSLIADNADKVTVGLFLGPEKLAVYFLGINIVKIIFDLSKTAVSVLIPKLSTRNTAIFKYYALMFLLTAPFAVIIYFLLPFIVPILFSEKYINSIGISQIAIAFLPFVFINLFYLSHLLYYVKNKKIIAFYTIILAGSKILLILPLIFYFETKGLAFLFGFQTVLSLVILYVLQNIFFSNEPKSVKAG